jgi:hypothetical protein
MSVKKGSHFNLKFDDKQAGIDIRNMKILLNGWPRSLWQLSAFKEEGSD